MVIYWIFYAVSLIAFMFDSGSSRTIKLGEDKTARRSQFLWPFLTLALIAFFSGARTNIADSAAYQINFEQAPNEFSELGEYISGLRADRLFYGTMALIKCIFPDATYTLWFFVVAIISAMCFFIGLYKHAENASFVVFLFVVSANYVWMFNGVRQFLAVCILFAASGLLEKKKWIQYFIVVFIAYNIHDSSLIMIPFYFIIQSKPWSKRVWFFVVAALIAVLFSDTFMNTMDAVLEDTSLSDAVQFAQKDTGSNIIRVFVAAVPAVLAFMHREEMEETAPQYINVCVNMSLITTLSYLMASFTSGIIIGRVPLYFELYSFVLLDWLLRNVFKEDKKFLMYALCILFYTAFFYYQVVITYKGMGYGSTWLGFFIDM